MIFSTATPVGFLYVTQRQRALDFYEGVLGLQRRSSDDYGDFLQTDKGLLRITAMPDFKAGSHPVVGWDVPNMEEAVEGLRARGVTLIIYDGLGQDALGIWTDPSDGTKVGWFSDPDGNILSLSQTPTI